MNQTITNKSVAENVCKHKAGDSWKDGCCGQDLLAQNSRENLKHQEKNIETSEVVPLA